jgi:hypothetical protein
MDGRRNSLLAGGDKEFFYFLKCPDRLRGRENYILGEVWSIHPRVKRPDRETDNLG